MLTRLHWLVLVACFSRYALKAVVEMKLDWDYLVYHLPFALRHVGLTTFRSFPHVDELYDAMPPLAHIVSGMLVWLTGWIPASSGFNVIALALLVGALKWLHPKASIRWLLTALLAVPIVVVHLPTGYVDFWTGAFAGIALIGALALERTIDGRAVAVTGIGVLGAMCSKYQAWPFVAVLGVGLALRLLWRARGTERFGRVALVIAGLAAVSALFPVRNLVRFGNPTHPYAPPLLHRWLKVEARANEFSFQRPADLIEAPAYEVFLHSLLETSRWRAPDFDYSVDQGFMGGPLSPHFRLGGWGVPVVLAWLVLAIYLFVSRSPLAYYSGVIGAFLVLVAVTPQGHELRYWMAVPIAFAIFWSCVVEGHEGRAWRWAKGACLLAAAWSVAQTWEVLVVRTRRPTDVAPPQAAAYWAAVKSPGDDGYEAICDKDKFSIFWSGPTFNEFPVRACDSWRTSAAVGR